MSASSLNYAWLRLDIECTGSLFSIAQSVLSMQYQTLNLKKAKSDFKKYKLKILANLFEDTIKKSRFKFVFVAYSKE